MRKKLSGFLSRKGARLCAFVLTIASISPVCCRGFWYQPEEPEGFADFVVRNRKA